MYLFKETVMQIFIYGTGKQPTIKYNWTEDHSFKYFWNQKTVAAFGYYGITTALLISQQIPTTAPPLKTNIHTNKCYGTLSYTNAPRNHHHLSFTADYHHQTWKTQGNILVLFFKTSTLKVRRGENLCVYIHIHTHTYLYTYTHTHSQLQDTNNNEEHEL